MSIISDIFEGAGDLFGGTSTADIIGLGLGYTQSQQEAERQQKIADQNYQRSQEYVDFYRQQYTNWQNVYGPIQYNLANFFEDYTADFIETQELQAYQQEFQKAQNQLTQQLAQRGLGGSGLEGEALTRMAQAGAEQRAGIRAEAPLKAAAAQTEFLKLGLGSELAAGSQYDQSGDEVPTEEDITKITDDLKQVLPANMVDSTGKIVVDNNNDSKALGAAIANLTTNQNMAGSVINSLDIGETFKAAITGSWLGKLAGLGLSLTGVGIIPTLIGTGVGNIIASGMEDSAKGKQINELAGMGDITPQEVAASVLDDSSQSGTPAGGVGVLQSGKRPGSAGVADIPAATETVFQPQAPITPRPSPTTSTPAGGYKSPTPSQAEQVASGSVGIDRVTGGGSGGSSSDNGGGSGRVICTHFYQKGILSKQDYYADITYTARNLSEETVKGYHKWAIPTVKLLRKYPDGLLEKFWWFITKNRCEELLYQLGKRNKPNYKGKAIRAVFEPLCWVIGKISEPQDYKVLYTQGAK